MHYSVLKGAMSVMGVTTLDKFPISQMKELVPVINHGSEQQRTRAMMAASFMLYYVVERFEVISRGLPMKTVFAKVCKEEAGISEGTRLLKTFKRNKVLLSGNFTTAELFDQFYWKGETGLKRAWRRTLQEGALLYPMSRKRGGRDHGDDTGGNGTVHIYTREKKLVQTVSTTTTVGIVVLFALLLKEFFCVNRRFVMVKAFCGYRR